MTGEEIHPKVLIIILFLYSNESIVLRKLVLVSWYFFFDCRVISVVLSFYWEFNGQNSWNRVQYIDERSQTAARKYEISLSTIVHLLFIIINIARDVTSMSRNLLWNHRVQIEALAATKQCCPILLFQPHTSNFNLTLKLGASKFLRSFIGNLQCRDIQYTPCNNGNLFRKSRVRILIRIRSSPTHWLINFTLLGKTNRILYISYNTLELWLTNF